MSQLAMEGIHNQQWPPDSGKTLFCEYLANTEADRRIQAEEKRLGISTSATTATGTGSSAGRRPSRGIGSLFSKATKDAIASTVNVEPHPLPRSASGDTLETETTSGANANAAVGSDRHLPPQSLRAPTPPPPPMIDMDALFKKTTQATPAIYYLPLTEEQVAEKRRLRQEQEANKKPSSSSSLSASLSETNHRAEETHQETTQQ